MEEKVLITWLKYLFTTNYRFYFLFLKWICILYWSTHLDVDVSCAGLPVLQYSMAQVEEEIPAQIKYFGVLRTYGTWCTGLAVLQYIMAQVADQIPAQIKYCGVLRKCQYSSTAWPR